MAFGSVLDHHSKELEFGVDGITIERNINGLLCSFHLVHSFKLKKQRFFPQDTTYRHSRMYIGTVGLVSTCQNLLLQPYSEGIYIDSEPIRTK